MFLELQRFLLQVSEQLLKLKSGALRNAESLVTMAMAGQDAAFIDPFGS